MKFLKKKARRGAPVFPHPPHFVSNYTWLSGSGSIHSNAPRAGVLEFCLSGTVLIER